MEKNNETVSNKKEYGRSFMEYFRELEEQANQNKDKTEINLVYPSDSFGQWYEAD